MEKKKNTYNHKTTELLIYVMGGIGIYMALGAIFIGNLMGYIMLMIIPLFLSIMFIITKQPIYGILYTILFITERICLQK